MPGNMTGNEILGGLWELCLSVSVVIAFLLLIRPLMKRVPRIGMYILWVMVVLRIVFPCPLGSIYRFLPVSVGQVVADVTQNAESGQFVEVQEDRKNYGGPENGYRLKLQTFSVPEGVEKEQSGFWGKKENESAGTGEPVRVNPEWAVLAVWFTGVLCCAVYLFRALWRSRRHFQNAVHVSGNVYEHHDVCGSFVGGVISPKIYVPAGTDADALRYILVHERIHIRRWDYRIKPFAFLAFSVLWFNPLVWIAYHCMIMDMEISCDEAVIRKLGEDSRKQYSYLLLAAADSENKRIRSHAAFGSRVVKERIYHVMKYRRPTRWMTVSLVMAVILCGCGIVSSNPPQTVKDLSESRQTREGTDGVYVEQTIAGSELDWGDGEGTVGGGGHIVVNRQGKIVMILELVEEQNEKRVSFAKAVLSDGTWQKEGITWGRELNKRLDGKNAEMENIYYDADGNLYLAFGTYSLSYEEYEKNEGGNYTEDDWYATDRLLFRVNEETGKIEEVDVPVQKEGDYACYNAYGFFADGNYFVSSGNTFLLFNSRTGEQVADLSKEQGKEGVPYAGDDFVVWEVLNREKKCVELFVYDEFGEYLYAFKLPSVLAYDREKGEIDSHAVGVRENTVFLAVRDGIFEAEYGDEEFHNVISQEKDNLYYFTPDGYKPCFDGIFKGGRDDYMLMLESDDGEKFVDCYYAKK